jgi:hypothetical protein
MSMSMLIQPDSHARKGRYRPFLRVSKYIVSEQVSKEVGIPTRIPYSIYVPSYLRHAIHSDYTVLPVTAYIDGTKTRQVPENFSWIHSHNARSKQQLVEHKTLERACYCA